MKNPNLTSRDKALYIAAVRADRAFSAAIRKVAGPRASRWSSLTLDQRQHPIFVRAYERKIAIDRAQSRATRVSRARAAQLSGRGVL